MKNPILLVIQREYVSRVRRRMFIISTLLFPILFIGLMALPSLVATMSNPSDKKVAVIDHTGYISKGLATSGVMSFEITDNTLDQLKEREDLDAVLVIPEDIVRNPSGASLYTYGSPSPQVQMILTQLLTATIEQAKLQQYNIEGLDQIIQDIHTDVKLQTYDIEDDGENASSTMASTIFGMLLTLILYMFIMMYGQMVMTSIIEEKNNRVLEIVVSSVNPSYLMLGKILGIGAVAVTQMLIWAVLIVGFSAGVMPSLLTNAVAAGGDVELMGLLSTLGNPVYILGLFGVMILFLVFGYMFYSSIYAAIGSAVDNVQDASQLQFVALVPIILGMVFSMSVINDPGSSFALLLSLIPFTSPMVMMARLPFGVPGWQIALSLGILVVTMLFTVWLSAKIYRVGIFMYGKKPSIRELIRWARYK